MTLAEVAREFDVSSAPLRRWTREGLVPLPEGRWTPAALAHARIVVRLRERGHSLDEIRPASESGRLAYGFMDDLFPPRGETHTLEEAAELSGREPALLERIWTAVGFAAPAGEEVSISSAISRFSTPSWISGSCTYYGRAVNLAARAAGGEVLVTRPLVEAGGDQLDFQRIGEVKLKGFSESTELFLASLGAE